MRLKLLPAICVISLAGCVTKKKDDSPVPPKKSERETPSTQEQSQTDSETNTKNTSSDPAFADLVKNNAITINFNNAAANRLAATVGAPSYQIAYVQSGTLIKQADLVSGSGQKYCSMAASAFVTANVAYAFKADKVKGRNMFGNATLEASNIGDIVTIHCEKIAGDVITLKDLQDIFGPLAVIAIAQ